MHPRIAIVYLSFHSEAYIKRALTAWQNLDYPKREVAVILVDNFHPQFGSSLPLWRSAIAQITPNNLPEVIMLPQSENTGFAKGNNIGIQWALDHGFDYIYLHNQDGFLAANTLTPLVQAFRADNTVGAAQSLILLADEPARINTAGNALHFLGFGYCTKFRELATVAGDKPFEIDYASGAGVMLSAHLLRSFGLLEEDLFLYHEDLEYSLRLRSVGKKIICVPKSIFYHEYDFHRNVKKWYYMERNRWAVLLLYYRIRTLALLLPLLLITEIGLLFFSTIFGWLPQKIRAYLYWLQPQHWGKWWQKRVVIQTKRTVDDTQLLRHTTAKFPLFNLHHHV